MGSTATDLCYTDSSDMVYCYDVTYSLSSFGINAVASIVTVYATVVEGSHDEVPTCECRDRDEPSVHCEPSSDFCYLFEVAECIS